MIEHNSKSYEIFEKIVDITGEKLIGINKKKNNFSSECNRPVLITNNKYFLIHTDVNCSCT